MGCGSSKKVTFDESAEINRKRGLDNSIESNNEEEEMNDDDKEEEEEEEEKEKEKEVENEDEDEDEDEEEEMYKGYIDDENDQKNSNMEEEEDEEEEEEVQKEEEESELYKSVDLEESMERYREEGDESVPKKNSNKKKKNVKKVRTVKKVAKNDNLNKNNAEEKIVNKNLKNKKILDKKINDLSKNAKQAIDSKINSDSLEKTTIESKKKLDNYEKEIMKKNRILNREEDIIKVIMPNKKQRKETFFGEEEQNLSGDEFLPVRPYANAIFEPSKYKEKEINVKLPDEIYNIEYAYGFRTEDVRQNVFFVNKTKIVYMTAALGVVLNISDNTQQFFGGTHFDKECKPNLTDHGESIISLALSSDKKLCATGESSNIPSVYIWKTDTCELFNFESKFKLNKGGFGIIALSFSNCNEYLAVCEKSEDNKVYVYSVSNGKMVYSERNISDSLTFICGASWSGKKNDLSFMTVGINHVKYWRPFAAHKTWSEGNFGKSRKINFGCVTSNDDGTFFAGAANGDIYVWKKAKVFEVLPAHLESVLSITYSNNMLISGGSDNKVIIFEEGKTKLKEIIVGYDVRAVDLIQHTLVVGCENGSIYVYKDIEEESPKIEVMSSHCKGETWGLEIIDNYAITTGDDNKIIIWDIEKRKKVKSYIIDENKGPRTAYGGGYLTDLSDNKCSRFICKNLKSENIAVATNAGTVQIRKSLDNFGETIFLLKEPKKWIEFMSFSPNGNFLAVGSHDNKIYVYNTGANYLLKGILDGNSGYICSFDWSADSKYLRTNSSSSELLYYDIESGNIQPIIGELTRNDEWETCYDKFAWESEGIFPEGVSQGSHVQSVCLSKKKRLLATSDCWYLLNVFRFPCRDKAMGRSYRGHSSIPSRIKFNDNGNYLFSVGGADRTLIQRKAGIAQNHKNGEKKIILVD